MKIISVVGGTQTGSTMLFNLLRLCLTQLNYLVYSCGINSDMSVPIYDDLDYTIVKCHQYNEFLATHSSIIFLPVRDFRDCAISWKKRYYPIENFDANKYIDNIITNINTCNSWKKCNPCIIKYESYVENKTDYIKNIIKILNVDNKNIDISLIVKQLELIHNGVGCPETDTLPENEMTMLAGNMVYITTLMTKAHNTSGGRIKKYLTDIDKSVLYEINIQPQIKQALISYGYDI